MLLSEGRDEELCEAAMPESTSRSRRITWVKNIGGGGGAAVVEGGRETEPVCSRETWSCSPTPSPLTRLSLS